MTRAQEAEERFSLKREVARLKRLASKKSRDSQSDEDSKKTDEDNKTEEYESSITTTISEDDGEEHDDSTDGGDKDTQKQGSPDKVFSEVCINYCLGLIFITHHLGLVRLIDASCMYAPTKYFYGC